MSETFLFVPDSTFPSADQEKNRQDYLPAYSEKAPSSAEAGLPAPSAVILLRKDRVRGHLKSGMEKESQKEGKPEIPEEMNGILQFIQADEDPQHPLAVCWKIGQQKFDRL